MACMLLVACIWLVYYMLAAAYLVYIGCCWLVGILYCWLVGTCTFCCVLGCYVFLLRIFAAYLVPVCFAGMFCWLLRILFLLCWLVVAYIMLVGWHLYFVLLRTNFVGMFVSCCVYFPYLLVPTVLPSLLFCQCLPLISLVQIDGRLAAVSSWHGISSRHADVRQS